MKWLADRRIDYTHVGHDQSSMAAAAEQDELYETAIREFGRALDRLAAGYDADPESATTRRQEIHLQLFWRSFSSSCLVGQHRATAIQDRKTLQNAARGYGNSHKIHVSSLVGNENAPATAHTLRMASVGGLSESLQSPQQFPAIRADRFTSLADLAGQGSSQRALAPLAGET